MKRPEYPPKAEIDLSVPINTEEWEKVSNWTKQEHLYWEEVKHRVKGWSVKPVRVWALIKTLRSFDRQYIKISAIKGFGFTFTIPVFLQKALHQLDLNMGGILQNENIIPPEDKDRYLISSLMEEAIASSQLEGAVTTRKIARDMLEKNKKPKTESERMIVNNYEVMRWIVQNYSRELTSESLLKVHSLITRDTLKDKSDEGSFRTSDEITVNDGVTNEVFYIPPSYKHLQKLIDDLCDFANNENENVFIHPVVKGIILHFLIGYIHPFVDGNGRTARTIFYWYLMRQGYWLVEYMSISRIILKGRAQYAKAYLFTEYDENDLTYFIAYNVKAVTTALEDLKKYIYKKTQEKKKIIALLKNINFNDRQVVLIKDLLQDKNQYFTVKQIEQRFKVSNQTARNDLVELQKKKVLLEKKSGKKSQFFAAENFEKILNIK